MKWFSKSPELMPVTPLMSLTNPDRSSSGPTMPSRLQDLIGDRSRVGKPQLLRRPEKSNDQPSQSSATAPQKRSSMGPLPHPQGRGRSPSLLPPTTGKDFKFSHRPQSQEVLGKVQACKGTEIRVLGLCLEPNFGLKTCLRNPGPSASA